MNLKLRLKQAEESLRQSEEKYRALVENINDVIFTLDISGRFTFISPVIEHLSAYKTNDIIGRKFTEFVYPDDLPNLVESFKRTMHGESEPIEFRILDQDGQVRYVRTSSRLNIHDGVVVGVTGIMADITGRKQTEEQLRQRNRELSLFNQIIAASAANSTPTAILEITCRELAAAFEVSGVVTALLDEQKTQAVIVAEHTATVPQPVLPVERPTRLGQAILVQDSPALQHLLRYKGPLVIDDTQNKPHLGPTPMMGKRGIASALLVPFVIEDQVEGIMCLETIQPHHFSAKEINLAWSVADQVAGALARVRLVQRQQRLSTAIEQAAESVVITDAQGNIVYVNPTFERVSGYRQAEVIGQNPRILKSGRQGEVFYENMWSILSAGQVWHGHFVNKKKDGALYTEEVTISPVRDDDGIIVNYVAVKRDVTRELQLEEQYLQAQKMEAIGQLTAGIAHDFNNLLTAINGFAELAQSRLTINPPLQDMLDKILRSGRRAADLVGQLMAFSRKQVLEPQIVNLNVVVTDIDKMLRRIIGEHITVQTILAPDLGLVKVDPVQLQQIIVNLAVNARDAMPNGGHLTIETANISLDENYTTQHLEMQPGDYILLAVTDNGAGMSAEVKAHIFEPFFTTKGLGRGTGLGLATVFGIVKQSGGHIWVYSEEGHGTTFKIYLPCVHQVNDPVTSPVCIYDRPVGKETILVVEDDSGVREFTSHSLSQQGYAVLEAADGREAIRLVQSYQEAIHLLLTDVIIPGTNGKALATELRQTYPRLRILFMSGYTNDAITRHGVLESGVAFLPKPFTTLGLTRKVREVLDAA